VHLRVGGHIEHARAAQRLLDVAAIPRRHLRIRERDAAGVDDDIDVPVLDVHHAADDGRDDGIVGAAREQPLPVHVHRQRGCPHVGGVRLRAAEDQCRDRQWMKDAHDDHSC